MTESQKYLGVPFATIQIKNHKFDFLKEKMQLKLQDWQAKVYFQQEWMY